MSNLRQQVYDLSYDIKNLEKRYERLLEEYNKLIEEQNKTNSYLTTAIKLLADSLGKKVKDEAYVVKEQQSDYKYIEVVKHRPTLITLNDKKTNKK